MPMSSVPPNNMNSDAGNEMFQRQLDTDGGVPTTQLVETISEIEGTEPTELEPIWPNVGGMVERLFSDPPSPDARMEIEFNYLAYRIRIEQDGSATFMKTE